MQTHIHVPEERTEAVNGRTTALLYQYVVLFCTIIFTMSNVQDLKPRAFNPEGVPKPPPTYNHVAITPLLPSSRLITLAGLTGCDPASQNNPTTLPEQARIAYSKIETCLAAAGATPRDIVQVSSATHIVYHYAC